MPSTIIKRAAKGKVRKGFKPRGNQPDHGCKTGQGASKNHDAIIADSIHSLVLKPKPGIITEVGKRKRYSGEEDYEKMYTDLLACYHNAMRLAGTPTAYDPLKLGLTLPVSLWSITRAMKEFIPKDFELNIDFMNDDQFCFTAFRYADFQQFWHTFDVKPILDLIGNNKPLRRLFLQVVSMMANKAGILTWYNGGLGHAEYMMDEEIEDWENRHDLDTPEDYEAWESAKKTFESYNEGEAKALETEIQNLKPVKLEQILKQLKPFKSKIAKWLREVCELLKDNECIDNFIYRTYDNDYNNEGLSFDSQVTLVYDPDDEYSSMQGECLDAEAQGVGVIDPCIYFHFFPDTKAIDFDKLRKSQDWLNKLTKVCQGQLNFLKNEKQPN